MPVLYRLLVEAFATYGHARSIGCVLSLGTGIPSKLRFETGIAAINDVFSMITKSEESGAIAEGLCTSLPLGGTHKYWRFNLSHPGLRDSSAMGNKIDGWINHQMSTGEYAAVMETLDNWKVIQLIRDLTNLWLQDKAREQMLEDCAQALAASFMARQRTR